MFDAELVEKGLYASRRAVLLETQLGVSMEIAPDLTHPGKDLPRRNQKLFWRRKGLGGSPSRARHGRQRTTTELSFGPCFLVLLPGIDRAATIGPNRWLDLRNPTVGE